MSRFNHKHQLQTKEIIYRVLFILAAITILVIFMPHHSLSSYNYTLGEPWDDNPVIAEESFPIYKSEETIDMERDSLKRYYKPYFLMNKDVQQEQEKAMTESLRALPKESVPDYYLPHLKKQLRYIYEQGVMPVEDYDRIVLENVQQISIYMQNEANNRNLKQVFTEKTAYEFLTHDKDSLKYTQQNLIKCNLARFLQPNLTYDAEKSKQQRQEIDATLVPFMGQVQVGQKIVDRGQIVDKYTYEVLRSLERHMQGRSRTSTEELMLLGGQICYATIMVLLLFCYFQQFRNDYIDNPHTVLLIMALTLIFPLTTYMIMEHQLMSVYVIPYCILPIFTRIFLDSRTAFMSHIIVILTCAVALHHPYEFIITQTVAGLVAIYSLKQLSQRSELVSAAVLVTCATLLTYFCIDVLHGCLSSPEGPDKWTYIFLIISGILSLLSYLLLIPVERIFGFTSMVTLVELSNVNNPLLRRLSEEAPGTFQHSMQVANLAAEVANKLGGRAQLVRTGALYHDIGKMENAAFFTENQRGHNPHDGLPFERSAQIIIAHVTDGLRLAEKYRLPAVIKDFISTHHGQSLVKYFYISYKNQFPDKEVDKALFTYPGPRASTLEQAILIMADTVEASSRSLSEYTEKSIDDLVERVIDAQVSEGYFKYSPINFQEIEMAKGVFKSKLKTIYHTRIQYPEIKKES